MLYIIILKYFSLKLIIWWYILQAEYFDKALCNKWAKVCPGAKNLGKEAISGFSLVWISLWKKRTCHFAPCRCNPAPRSSDSPASHIILLKMKKRNPKIVLWIVLCYPKLFTTIWSRQLLYRVFRNKITFIISLLHCFNISLMKSFWSYSLGRICLLFCISLILQIIKEKTE